MKNICIFASGTGSNFENIVKSVENGTIQNACVPLLICDNPKALVIQKAKHYNINVHKFFPKNYLDKQSYEKEILKKLNYHNINIIALAGYMRIIGSTILTQYEGKIINIHPSLLPNFPGKNGIKDAYMNNAKVTGVTVHYVDSGVDTGEIISQKEVPIYTNDTIESLSKKINKAEHELYIQVLQKLVV